MISVYYIRLQLYNKHGEVRFTLCSGARRDQNDAPKKYHDRKH